MMSSREMLVPILAAPGPTLGPRKMLIKAVCVYVLFYWPRPSPSDDCLILHVSDHCFCHTCHPSVILHFFTLELSS